MTKFSPEFEAYLQAVEAGEDPAPPNFKGRPFVQPLPPRPDMSEQRRRQRRHMQDAATKRAELTLCQMPLCIQPSLILDGKGLGICLRCSFAVIDYWDRTAEKIKADEMRTAIRERRVRKQLHEQVLGEKERERRRQAPGWIYYILINDRIKIGYSKDLKSRMRDYPPDSPILAIHPGTKQLESEMHAKFAGSKAAGREWFLDTPELRQHIKDVISQFGEPDRARYEHRGQHKQRNLKAS
ncbi:GIY-YIG nuclease family protein [Aeromicrobium sp. 9AM]|uniref:GIY-YIG nuclease family protein n=1 Tax=Aeromicrobium sp. 9AM TaxID=2653126 RepID=UPI0012F0CF35|nr:GIY-YIG nuclease family protein [Aeromicrobium sp. 9AM]VXC07905.1 hypothetical protein AERO9AM_30625 [Aeromicrobium sp. 9AM]